MKQLIQKRMCMTKDIGVQGNLFGGNMLAILDECGAILAAEEMRSKSIVTAHIDAVNFKRPVKEHDILHIFGDIKQYGVSSLTLQLEAYTVDPSNQEELLVCNTQMVFVHIDETGHSSPYERRISN